jgi:hypothetical protein
MITSEYIVTKFHNVSMPISGETESPQLLSIKMPLEKALDPFVVIWLTRVCCIVTKFHKVWHAFGETESPQLFDDIVS